MASNTKRVLEGGSRERENNKTLGDTISKKYPPLKPSERKLKTKANGLLDTQLNSIRRRCKNINSHTLLSTTTRTDCKKEIRPYYIKDVKNSVSEFSNNEEFMDPHLTHFMESISTFKMFSCSYLPQKPHKVVELPPLSDNKITLVFDLDETLVHSQILHW